MILIGVGRNSSTYRPAVVEAHLALEPVDVHVELAVSDRSLLCERQPESQGSAESNGRVGDVALGEVRADVPITPVAPHDRREQRCGPRAEVGPLGIVEERVDQVDDADAVVDRGVEVLPKRVEAVGPVRERRLARGDTPLDRLARRCVEK